MITPLFVLFSKTILTQEVTMDFYFLINCSTSLYNRPVFEIGNINFVYAETYGGQIDSVMDDRRHYDVMADNVYQQISNGGYRTVDMLAIMEP